MFEIKNITKKYGDEFALNNVSMNIGNGLNFIVGASGSGKTTLLKIISSMEQDFDGEVSYCGKDIKNLTSSEKSYFYNNNFGFVWQDFNLLEDSTVLENVMLPCYLKSTNGQKNAEKILKDLKINDLAGQKVKYLSGGQKQRVSIARELMKNPQVIIADEPTSALDEKTSKTIMDILRVLAKTRAVIVVTHDTSLISDTDHVFELDKGELVSKPQSVSGKKSEVKMQNTHELSLKGTLAISKSVVKSKISRFAVSILTLMIASVLLLTTLSGAIQGSSQEEFDKLIKTYGESLLDINIADSFMDASGTGQDENKKPDGTVEQSIEGLYDKYAKDERVSFMLYEASFDDITIKLDGKNHTIKKSGNVPQINKLLAGKMPSGDGNEIVVPESFVKKLGVSNEQAIGEEIDFTGTVYNWSTGQAVPKTVSCKAEIVGVIDTTTTYEFEGKVYSTTLDDSFFFSKSALTSMQAQADNDMKNADFLIRPKTPADMIAIKNELNKNGIVPLGRFELVEDIVKLSNQTVKQSGSAGIIIDTLSVVMVVAIFLITGVLRKREYAIYKVSGYNNRHLSILALSETMIIAVSAILLMLVASPLLSMATEQLFGVSILNVKMLFTGALLILLTSVVAYITAILPFSKTNPAIALKAGEH